MTRRLVNVCAPKRSIWIGFDPRETASFMVSYSSTRIRLTEPILIKPLELYELARGGLYTRPTQRVDGHLFDSVSNHAMSTEFACSRFLVPHLAQTGWALFMDCDMLVLDDLADLFDMVDDRYAVMCVKHDYRPPNVVKMHDQIQTQYFRKNWSSVCLFNCDHPSNKKLTLEMFNTTPGRDLHAFCWLDDEEIGELPEGYNFLVGWSKEASCRPHIIHFTEGTPDMKGHEDCQYSQIWKNELRKAVHSIF